MKSFVCKTLTLIITALLLPLAFSRPVCAAGGSVDVGLTKYERVSSVNIESGVINVFNDAYGAPVYTFDSGSGFTVSASGEGAAISRGGEVLFVTDGNSLLRGAEGTTRIGGISYRGFIKPVRAASLITLVNVVDMEEYLCGVVPAEMSASWNIEALKAQAVAARSYAYVKAGAHSANGYELCDTVHCQYYPGMSRESQNSTDAVNQTAGLYARYDSEPIEAVFASSSGGHTESGENVWTAQTPYLRGVKEVAENEFLEWTREYTLQTISSGLSAKGMGVGSVTSVTAEYFPSGRLAKLTFNGTGGSRTVEKDAIRSITSEIGGSLPSNLFKINGYAWSQNGVWDGGSAETVYVLGAEGNSRQRNVSGMYAVGSENSFVMISGAASALGEAGGRNFGEGSSTMGSQNTFTITSGSLVFEGRGNGHGCGLSQYGAKGMAEAGYDYVQILEHYFTGIDVY